MAKKSAVTFTASDMPKPKRLASGLIGLRAPIDFKVLPGKVEAIDLNTKCNTLLLLAEGIFAQGIFAPGTNIVIRVQNFSDVIETYVAGDVIARAYPLFPVDYEIE